MIRTVIETGNLRVVIIVLYQVPTALCVSDSVYTPVRVDVYGFDSSM